MSKEEQDKMVKPEEIRREELEEMLMEKNIRWKRKKPKQKWKKK